MMTLFRQHRLGGGSLLLRLLVTVVMASVVSIAHSSTAHAATGINPTINYQGKLTSSGGTAITNGAYNMRFKIFDVATGGTALWTETWNSGTSRVTATGGLFSLALGTYVDITTIDFNSDSLYLQVELDADGNDTYEEVFAPRRRFSSVPYAHNARLLGGLESDQFLRSDVDATASGTLTVMGDAIVQSDLIARGTLSGAALTIMNGSSSFLGSVAIGKATAVNGVKLDVAGTMSGASLIISGNSTFRGAVEMMNNLIVHGSYSGSTIHASNQLSSSGTLIVNGNATFGSVVSFQRRGSAPVSFTPLDAGTLEASGSILVKGGTGRTLLTLKSATASGATDIFKVFSNVNTGYGSQSGNLVFRVTGSGGVYSDSSYHSSGADYAEWFYSSVPLRAGETVCIDVLKNNTVTQCSRSADPNVMGIVSTNPAFVGNVLQGADGLRVPGTYLIGLIGQVPAHVTLEGGAIRPGDALTSATKPGYARRAKAGESTVGVALESFGADGQDVTTEGTVNVLISRRNQSLTVEAVEQEVMLSIKDMAIEDDVLRMVQDATTNLGLEKTVADAIKASLTSDATLKQVQQLFSGALLPLQNAGNQSNVEADLIAAGSGITLLNAQVSGLSQRLAELEKVVAEMKLHAAATATGSIAGEPYRVVSTLDVMDHFELIQDQIARFSLSGSAIRIGALAEKDSIEIIGRVTVPGLAEFLGDVHIEGELSLSGKQAGIAMIPKSGTAVAITFSGAFVGTPVITASADTFVLWRLQHRSQTGFTIELREPATEETTFTWLALSSLKPQLDQGSSASLAALIPFPIDAQRHPLSSDPIWNACIRGQQYILGGEVISCARYHSEHVWEHPDLHISFVYRPNNDPVILMLPAGYIETVQEVPTVSVEETQTEPAQGVEQDHAAEVIENAPTTNTDVDSIKSATEESDVPATEDAAQVSAEDSTLLQDVTSSSEQTQNNEQINDTINDTPADEPTPINDTPAAPSTEAPASLLIDQAAQAGE